jgi:hypothetical protein
MIAISYRREDSSPVTGRLFDRLQTEFGRRNVFMDFDSIPFGVDFRDKIKHALERARVVIAVVGPNWAGKRATGKHRIDDPTDIVRMEIAAALQRGIPVIPVLLDSTVMPNAEDLPEELRPFAYRNALVLDTGIDFHHHADRLIRGIHELLDGRLPGKPKGRWVVGILVILALVAVAILWSLIAHHNSQPRMTGPVTPAPTAKEASVMTPSATSTLNKTSQADAIPNPVLYLMSQAPFTAGGKNWIRYRYDVLNKADYPADMFAAAPGLPPCGSNTNASRTWVDFFDSNGKRLYGFCALSKPADLGRIWFALEEGVLPPSYVYIELNDRQTKMKYKSNLVATPTSSVTPPSRP